MNCTSARQLILLDAGGDLYAEEQSSLQQHLHSCVACSQYAEGMRPVMSVLCSLRDAPVTSTPISVWPSVRAAIRLQSAATVPARRFNLQVAALAVCSLSLAAAVIVQTLTTMRTAEQRPQAFVLPGIEAPAASLRSVPVSLQSRDSRQPMPRFTSPAVF